MLLRIGTRASALARWQAEWAAARIRENGVEAVLTPIATAGDASREPLGTIGGQGVFTKEIQRALLDGRIDLAVHSLKDLPTGDTPGLCLAAVPERGPAGDVLVCPTCDSVEALPRGAVVGTGSPRRRAQLLRFRRDLIVKDIRGNVDTRLRKLDRGEYDALILAEAGLQRLGLADRIARKLPVELMLPAVGQGALGLEIRADDPTTRRIASPLDHPPSRAAVQAERAMLAALGGGCSMPIAALARLQNGRLVLAGRVLDADGLQMAEVSREGSADAPEILGRQAADALLAAGAGEILSGGQ